MSFDTVIVGGGPIGSSIAYHLARHFAANGGQSTHKIAVIERDSSYRTASAMLSAGGIRQQFSVEENIRMSIYGAQFLKNMNALEVDGEVPDIQFHENGYLYLSTERTKHIMVENNKTQHACGATWIDLYSQQQLKEKFPWLNTENISIGSFSSQNEGYFDPWSYVNALKKKAVSLGVTYIDGVVTDGKLSLASSTSTSTYEIEELRVQTRAAANSSSVSQLISINAGEFVNAAGAWAGALVDSFANSTGNPKRIAALPVKPRKRCIFTVHCPGRGQSPVPPSITPLVIDPSGCYFRPEGNGGRFIVGVSPSENRDFDCMDRDLETVDHDLYDSIIWPSLYERVPAFEELKVLSSWAGFYEYNTVDQNAIIGRHSEIKNLILCNGFSGHGLQQSPAAGLAVSELIAGNRFETIDLRRFSFERIVDNKPIFETGIV